jgi:hypothetical protein
LKPETRNLKAEWGTAMEDLKDRTRNYSLRIIRLYESLGTRGVSRVLGDQMLRSGTSVGARAILVTLTKNAKNR